MSPLSFLLHFYVTIFLKNETVWGNFFHQFDFFQKKIPSLSQCWHKVENDSQDHFYCLFSVKTLKFCLDKTKLMVFQPLKKSPLEKKQSPIEAQNPHDGDLSPLMVTLVSSAQVQRRRSRIR